MTLEQAEVTRICKRVVYHGLSTEIVAEEFEITRRQVQQLAKEYRESGDVLKLETPGRRSYADHLDDLADHVLTVHERFGSGAVPVAQTLRVCNDRSIATNTVHEILKDHETVTENPRNQGRQRP